MPLFTTFHNFLIYDLDPLFQEVLDLPVSLSHQQSVYGIQYLPLLPYIHPDPSRLFDLRFEDRKIPVDDLGQFCVEHDPHFFPDALGQLHGRHDVPDMKVHPAIIDDLSNQPRIQIEFGRHS